MKERKENVQLRPDYEQVCVWPGTVLGEHTPTDFEQWFKDQGFDIQYLEEVETKPDMKDGKPVEGTGGRIDQFFAVHKKDIAMFALFRFQYGIRWLEDATSEVNGYDKNPIYPERLLEYKSW